MLQCKNLFSITTATQFGQVTFDAKGESRDLTIEQEQYLAERIQDFNFIDETPEVEAEVEISPEEEPEPKPEEVKQPVKKRTTRKKADTTEE